MASTALKPEVEGKERVLFLYSDFIRPAM